MTMVLLGLIQCKRLKLSQLLASLRLSFSFFLGGTIDANELPSR